MDLTKRAQQAVADIVDIVGQDISPGQREAIGKVIGDLAVTAMRECAASCGTAAAACCSQDEDMAHKIAREVDRAKSALIANLSALR